MDPEVFLGWFGTDAASRGLRAEFEAGTLAVVVPPTFTADVLEAAAAAGWRADRLARLAAEIPKLGFNVADPPADLLAGNLERGLGGRGSAYLAVATAADLRVVTRDERLLRHPSAVAP